ncbi:Arc family DNA-binding protein [Pseudomonas capsici]|uniref:Arc family DNA-binding protein n=1 Tax=Pseudomonas capsici TaxID=2810614 RepID=UPI0021F16835|nr:Arc family DNA-binding protein [Pseudomonas capsici]MCV4285111.1 Arc family DNA-binding protein [Pseudomonas capsici]
MEEDIYRSQFRLPYTLYELLKASADENHRSVNAELVARLESSFKKMDLVRHSLGLPITDPHTDPEASQETQARPISGPSKEKLLASLDEAVTEKEGLLLAAMLDAFRKIEDPVAWEAAQPSKGPKPRKRYPKE